MPTYIKRGTFLKLSGNSPNLVSIIWISSSVLLTILTIRVKKVEPYEYLRLKSLLKIAVRIGTDQ